MRKHFTSIILLLLVNICQAQPFSTDQINEAKKNAKSNFRNYLIETEKHSIQLKGNKYAIVDQNLVPETPFKYYEVRSGIRGGFIVKNSAGYHILDHNLKRITPKNYKKIWVYAVYNEETYETEKYYELRIGSKTKYFVYNEKLKKFRFEKHMESTAFIVGPEDVAIPSNSIIKKVARTRDKYLPKVTSSISIGKYVDSPFDIHVKGKKTLVSQSGSLKLKTKNQISTIGNFIIEFQKSGMQNLLDNQGELILTECSDILYYDTLVFVYHKPSTKDMVSVFGLSGKQLFTIESKSIDVHEYRHSSREFRYLHVHQNKKSAIVNLEGVVVYQGHENETITVQEHFIRANKEGVDRFGYLYEMDKPILADYTDISVIQNLVIVEKSNSNEVFDRNQNSLLKDVKIESVIQSETSGTLLILSDADHNYIANPGLSEVVLKTPYELVTNYYMSTNGYVLVYTGTHYGAIMLHDLTEIPPIYHWIRSVSKNKSFLVLNSKLKLAYVRYDGTELFD